MANPLVRRSVPTSDTPMSYDVGDLMPVNQKRESSVRSRRLLTSEADTTFEYYAFCRGHTIVSRINYSQLERVRKRRQDKESGVT